MPLDDAPSFFATAATAKATQSRRRCDGLWLHQAAISWYICVENTQHLFCLLTNDGHKRREQRRPRLLLLDLDTKNYCERHSTTHDSTAIRVSMHCDETTLQRRREPNFVIDPRMHETPTASPQRQKTSCVRKLDGRVLESRLGDLTPSCSLASVLVLANHSPMSKRERKSQERARSLKPGTLDDIASQHRRSICAVAEMRASKQDQQTHKRMSVSQYRYKRIRSRTFAGKSSSKCTTTYRVTLSNLQHTLARRLGEFLVSCSLTVTSTYDSETAIPDQPPTTRAAAYPTPSAQFEHLTYSRRWEGCREAG